MNKRMIIFLTCLVLAAGALVIGKNVYPYSKLEIWVLHQIYTRGSGWDDAAFHIVSGHPHRYAPQVRRMLDRAPVGSGDEGIALDFVEFVIDEPGIRDSLRRRGEAHSDESTASLISALLNGPPKTVTIGESDGISVKLIVPENDQE